MKISDVKVGETIIADDGFTCMDAGAKVVKATKHGLCIDCRDGEHYLDGQQGDDGELIGLRRAAIQGMMTRYQPGEKARRAGVA